MTTNTIIVGRAEVVLRRFEPRSIPLFLFSPPYNLDRRAGGRRTSVAYPGGGITHSKGHYADVAAYGARGGAGKWRNGTAYDTHNDAMEWDAYAAWQADVLRAAWRACSGAIYYNHKPRVQSGVLITPLDYVPPDLRPFVRQEIVWARAGGVNMACTHYMPTHERIIIIARPEWRLKSKGASGVGDVWSIPQQANTWHPAPFPEALAARVLETTGAPLVCDPFMGSGTTGRAAVRAGVAYIGIEKSGAYAARAQAEINRIDPSRPMSSAGPLFAALEEAA